jgi:hypothetical protein
VIAIGFVFKNHLDGTIFFSDPKLMGPIDTYTAKRNVDEIILTLSPEEEVYLVKGNFETCKTDSNSKSIRIVKLTIFTTFGQFVDFGEKNLGYNFTWEYFFNLRYFDGFIIGWDETHINYLASLVIERSPNQGDELVQLNDSSRNHKISHIDPLFLTSCYGRVDTTTNVDDDLKKYSLFELAKERLVYISEINVYYDKCLHSIEVEYTNRRTREKIKVQHNGSDSKIKLLIKLAKKNKDKKCTLTIEENDCINFIRFSYDMYIQSLCLKTFNANSLYASQSSEAEHKIEIYDASLELTVNLLGFVIGYGDKIHSLQFYYDKKFI